MNFISQQNRSGKKDKDLPPFTFLSKKNSLGFTLIEIMLYVSLFTFVSSLSMNALIQTIRAFNDLRISRDINDSSVKIMERMTRDIKSATAVDLLNSTFGASPGRLTLTTVNASGTPTTVEYYISNSILLYKENGVAKGSLMSARTKIDALVFYYINTGATVAIKTELHVSSARGTVSDADHFYDTSILRGTY